MKRVLITTATALVACMLFAATWHSDDSVLIQVDESVPESNILETILTEEGSGITAPASGAAATPAKAAASAAAKPAADAVVPEAGAAAPAANATAVEGAGAPKLVMHPADQDLYAWSSYTTAKATAAKKLTPKKFKAAVKACSNARVGTAEKCGTFFCAAKAECGKPCKKLYGSVPEQVIPLQPGGPMFHRVKETENKERHNKALKAQYEAAKEAAVKEHAEKAKEKADKEVAFKHSIGEEMKVKAHVAEKKEAREKEDKEGLKQEFDAKEAKVKANIKQWTENGEHRCDKASDAFLAKCEADKAAELQQKIVAKERRIKLEVAANKTAEAKRLARNIVNMSHELKIVEGKAGAANASAAAVPGAVVVTPVATANASEAPVVHIFGETENKCTKLDGPTCIVTLGCDLDAETNTCNVGLLPKMTEANATAVITAEGHPFAEADNCEDDGSYETDKGLGCADIDFTTDEGAQWCASEGDKTFPGSGGNCDVDGTGCKTANQACCGCKIIAAGQGGVCTDVATWQGSTGDLTNEDYTCATVTKDFCSTHGDDLFPGDGCAEDGKDCMTANEACCTCIALTAANPAATTPAATAETTPFDPNRRRLLQAAEADGEGGAAEASGEDATAGNEDATAAEAAAEGTRTEAVAKGETDADADVDAAVAGVKALTGVKDGKVDAEDVTGKVPTREEIDTLVKRVQDANMNAAKAAVAADKLIASEKENVMHASEMSINATLKASELENRHHVDATGADFIKDEILDGLDDTLGDADHEIANVTAQMEIVPESAPCVEQKEYFAEKCHLNETESMKHKVQALTAKMEKAHKEFEDKVKKDAKQWGDALKASKAAALNVNKTEAKAEAAITAMEHKMPKIEFAELLALASETDQSKCDAAKSTAYHQCRSTQNSAYSECVDIFTKAVGGPGAMAAAEASVTGDCSVCVKTFVKRGGCAVWKKGEDPSKLVPKGCMMCAKSAAARCGIDMKAIEAEHAAEEADKRAKQLASKMGPAMTKCYEKFCGPCNHACPACLPGAPKFNQAKCQYCKLKPKNKVCRQCPHCKGAAIKAFHKARHAGNTTHTVEHKKRDIVKAAGKEEAKAEVKKKEASISMAGGSGTTPTKACDACVDEFDSKGGCEKWKKGEDPTELIPQGCSHCGDEAAKHCGITHEDMADAADHAADAADDATGEEDHPDDDDSDSGTPSAPSAKAMSVEDKIAMLKTNLKIEEHIAKLKKQGQKAGQKAAVEVQTGIKQVFSRKQKDAAKKATDKEFQAFDDADLPEEMHDYVAEIKDDQSAEDGDYLLPKGVH